VTSGIVADATAAHSNTRLFGRFSPGCLDGIRLDKNADPTDAFEEIAIAEDNAVIRSNLDEEAVCSTLEEGLKPPVLSVLRLIGALLRNHISVDFEGIRTSNRAHDVRQRSMASPTLGQTNGDQFIARTRRIP
jgi:hypothetical protein